MTKDIPNAKRPLISIITVTYQAEDTVGKTMRSVASQTWKDYEHIVMDGASTDGTKNIVKQYLTHRTRFYSSPDSGIYDAMNKALKVAEGEYVLFLNAGDIFADSNVLERFARVTKSENIPDIIYGQTLLVDNTGKILGERHLRAPEKLTLDDFRSGMVVCHQAFMVKRRIAPFYNLNYRYSSDYEWCIKCLQASRKNVYLGHVPVIHYLSEGATTGNFKKSLIERFKIMKNYFGILPALWRHIGFAIRYIKRRKQSVNIQ